MSSLPSKDEILAWIAAHPAETSKREIAKAFGVKGAERIELKRILREMQADGHLRKTRKTYRDRDRLPPVSVLLVTGPVYWVVRRLFRPLEPTELSAEVQLLG